MVMKGPTPTMVGGKAGDVHGYIFKAQLMYWDYDKDGMYAIEDINTSFTEIDERNLDKFLELLADKFTYHCFNNKRIHNMKKSSY